MGTSPSGRCKNFHSWLPGGSLGEVQEDAIVVSNPFHSLVLLSMTLGPITQSLGMPSASLTIVTISKPVKNWPYLACQEPRVDLRWEDKATSHPISS